MSLKSVYFLVAVAFWGSQTLLAQAKAPEARTGEKPAGSAVNPSEAQKQADVMPVAKPAEIKSAAAGAEAKPEKAEKADKLPLGVTYGDKGLTFDTGDGKFGLTMQHRLQFRYAYPFDADPRTLTDLDAEGHSFLVRRARFKVNGYAYKKWLKYNMQYDWSQPVLRDFSIDVARFSWATLRIGRAKVLYNDERVASSGRQQFVNRSILNDVFTVDRQQGVQLIGRVLENTPADFNYMVGVFSGRGVGERLNDDASMMYAARLQWNAVGDPIEWSQSDDKYTQRLNLNIAFGAATNKSNCTAFETDAVSCRRLPGSNYPPPASTPGAQAGMFKVDQGVFEIRSVYKGLYFKHESHVKRVIDQSVTTNAWPRDAEMWGALVQLGYFPHAVIDWVPSELEVAGRVAWVDPNIAVSGNNQNEYTGILNWFANSHNNKISFEVSQLVLQNPAGGNSTEQRYRSQWEFSF
ncbi:porin [Turneriella parva]|uniref:Phosphate-selective porin O and P n=1 Tax=Turneriella parva (strain ATCC BAA-1111 / DSM 21527 / NCTC 11395 / H) TaxID=869212 RepID=I4BAH5_TURPD|nr:porin [Turneriella parva]AFM14282.1 phosphate-selective porin O and P [Turneriella parva DSM 21527]